MDGIHDLGGKQGFGPIPIDDNTIFHHSWEERMWAMARSGINPPGMVIDWFRHGIEQMVPSDYLSFAYFNKWCTNYHMLLIDGEVFTMSEVFAGHTENRSIPPPALSIDEVLSSNKNSAKSYAVDVETPPRHAVGDKVITKRLMHSGHTRLPAYARGASGTVISHHGAHVLADQGALGVHHGEHLYTVSFSATELWGDDANPRDTVTLELWEIYFV